MPVISSHLLCTVDGTHAAGVPVNLTKIDSGGMRATIFESETDEGGRLLEVVEANSADEGSVFEISFGLADFFASGGSESDVAKGIVREAVLRFSIPDAEARYHFPLMIAPNGYSAWWPGIG